MAQGDVVTNITSVAASGVLDIRPSSGVEWVVHNILYASGPIELWKKDGTNSFKYDEDSSTGGRFNLSLHATNSVWYQVKNVSSGAVLISYDGIQTK